MVNQAKKMGYQNQQKSSSASAKLSESVIGAIESEQKIEEKMFEAGRDNVENLMRTSDKFNRTARKCASICSDNITACVESSNKAFPILQEFTTEIMESCNRTFVDCAEIAKEATACRTIKGMVELQSRAVQQAFSNYFDTTSKLCNMLFDSCSQVMEPLNERTSVASAQIRKAFAA